MSVYDQHHEVNYFIFVLLRYFIFAQRLICSCSVMLMWGHEIMCCGKVTIWTWSLLLLSIQLLLDTSPSVSCMQTKITSFTHNYHLIFGTYNRSVQLYNGLRLLPCHNIICTVFNRMLCWNNCRVTLQPVLAPFFVRIDPVLSLA